MWGQGTRKKKNPSEVGTINITGTRGERRERRKAMGEERKEISRERCGGLEPNFSH